MRDAVIKFSVGAIAHAVCVREAGGRRIVHGCVGTVALAGVAMAVGAFVLINGARGREHGGRGCDGVSYKLCGSGNGPVIGNVNGVSNRKRDHSKKRNENEFAEAEPARRIGSGGQEKIFAYARRGLKRENQGGMRLQWPRKINQSNSALKKRIAAATSQAIRFVRREFVNSPIFERSPVN